MKRKIPFGLCAVLCCLGSVFSLSFATPTMDPIPQALPADKCFGEVLDTAYITSFTDCDHDGYLSKFWLTINMFDAAPIESAYLEIWIESPGCDIKLHTTPVFELPVMHYELGIPGASHIKGKLTVRLINTADDRVADEYTLEPSVQVESAENDYSVYPESYYWIGEKSVDGDGDGYFSTRNLYLNLNGCNGSKSIFFTITACRNQDSEEMCEEFTSPVFDVDKPGEIHEVSLSGLENGEYTIHLQVFLAEDEEPVSPVIELFDAARFELPEEDEPVEAIFTVSNIRALPDGVDKDQDGFYRARDYSFKVGTDGGEYTLTGKILHRPSGSDQAYTLTESIPDFAVGAQGIEKQVSIDGLSHDAYDFRLELYHGTSLVSLIEPEEDEDFQAQKFETPAEDNPVTVDSVFTAASKDWDGDGLPSSKTIQLNFTNHGEATDVYIIMLEYTGESQATNDTSDVFMIPSGISVQTLEFISKYRPEAPWIFFRIMDAVTNQQLLEADLMDEFAMEFPEDDILVTLKSFNWIEATDKDGDGYARYRKLALDFDSNPVSSDLEVMVSLCGVPVLAGPCPYTDGISVHADNTSEDITFMEFGLPNEERMHNMYSLQLIATDPVSGDVLVEWMSLEDDLKLELSEEDEYRCTLREIKPRRKLVDKDRDGYSSRARMFFRIRAAKEIDSVYAIVEVRSHDEMFFTPYHQTELFKVRSRFPGFFNTELGGSNPQLPHGSYEIRVRLMDKTGKYILASLNAYDVPDFAEMKMETREDDRPGSILPDVPPISGFILPGETENKSSASATKLNSNEPFGEIRAYPNPVSEKISLRLSDSEEEVFLSVSIIDMQGRTRIVRNYGEAEMLRTTTLIVDDLESGVYVIRIDTNQRTLTLSVIKK